MRTDDKPPRFESVDWSQVGESRRWMTPERATLLVGLLSIGGLLLYDRLIAHVYLIGSWNVAPIEWLAMTGTVVLLAYGVVPLARRPRTVRRLAQSLQSHPLAAGAVAYLAAFVIVGTIGPTLTSYPGINFSYMFQPPVGFTVDAFDECAGRSIGTAFDKQCVGSWQYPLGTNHRGFPMEYLLVTGARTALYVVVATAAFVVPVATGVGVVAGLRGGIVDDLLMAYVDVQLSIPAIVVYFLGYSYYGPSLLLLIVAFGLLSWGGIARLARSEVIQRREDGHVLVARSLGASDRYLAWRHIVPNVTNTLVPAAFQLLALLVLFEAGVAFLGFHELETYSWGSTISESTNAMYASAMQSRASTASTGVIYAHKIWWASTLPAAALLATMLSFKLIGDWLRDALDPRTTDQ